MDIRTYPIHVRAVHVCGISIHAPLYAHRLLPSLGSLSPAAEHDAAHSGPVCTAVAVHSAVCTVLAPVAFVAVFLLVIVVSPAIAVAVVVVVVVVVFPAVVVLVVVVVVIAAVVLVCTRADALHPILCQSLSETSVVCSTASPW